MAKVGWIRLHRKLTEKGYYKKSHYVHLWVHLLLKANHKANEFMFNGKMILVKQGQLITGRNQLSEETGIASSTVERILKTLENEQQIEQQKTSKFRLITIKKWDNYQLANEGGQESGQQADSKRTASGQQADTNNNDNNVKNDKNVNNNKGRTVEEQSDELAQELRMYQGEYPKEMLEAFWNYWSEPNKSKTKIRKETQGTWDTARRLKRWKSNQNKYGANNGTNKHSDTESRFQEHLKSIAADPDLQ